MAQIIMTTLQCLFPKCFRQYQLHVFLSGWFTSCVSFLQYRIPFLVNNLFPCLMNCLISWLSVSLPFQHCKSFALNNWMISPMVLSLDWACTKSNAVIHFGFNGWSVAFSRWLKLSGFDTVFDMEYSDSGCVGWLCPDNVVMALLIIGVSGISYFFLICNGCEGYS